MTTTLRLQIPEKLVPVFQGEADVRGSYGGRGSAKTRTFAKMTAVRAHMWDMAGRSGQILCGRQYMNSLADSSLEEIKAAILSEPLLMPHFDIGEKYIKTRSGRIYYSFTGLDRSLDSIKSKARILLGWVDEAEPVTDEAWVKLIPTLREEDSELWATWNPESERAPAHKRFRAVKDPRYKVVEMNWRDNPWFPEKLNRDRLRDKRDRPDQYDHIWEGSFATVIEGAYYARLLEDAKREGRVTKVGRDPHAIVRLFADIGGTGAKADSFVFWAVQFVGKAINVLDYYEAVGQPIGAHLRWLRERRYVPGDASIWLPHDGDNNERTIDWNYATAFREAGYDVEVVPNQGKGAAKMRVEAGRRRLPFCWFNDEPTKPGRGCLAHYHEKKHKETGALLGPEHGWSSHAADAFGMMCQVYEPPSAFDLPEIDTRWVI